MARNVFGKLSEIPRWKNVNKPFPSAHRNHPSMENMDISTVTVSKCLASSVLFSVFLLSFKYPERSTALSFGSICACDLV